MAEYVFGEKDYQIWRQIKQWFADNNLAQSNPKRNRSPVEPDQLMVKLKITSIIDGQGGRYFAKLIQDGVADIAEDATDPIAVEDLGVLTDDETLIVWNLSEIGSGGHSIDLTSDAACTQVGYMLTFDAVQNMWVVAIGGSGGDPGFYVRISSYASIIGNPGRFTYSGKRQVAYIAGQFRDSTTDTATVTPIYNSIESNNDGMGIEGNSADLTKYPGYPGGTQVKPIIGNPVVWVRPRANCNGDREYIFDGWNGMPEICVAT